MAFTSLQCLPFELLHAFILGRCVQLIFLNDTLAPWMKKYTLIK